MPWNPRFLIERPAWHFVAIGAAILAIVIAADLWTISDLTLSPLYLLPVAVVAWGAGRTYGTLMALAASVAWLLLALHETRPARVLPVI